MRRILFGGSGLVSAAIACGMVVPQDQALAQTAGPKAPFTAILDGDVNTNFGIVSGQQNAAHNRANGLETNAWLRFFFEGHADNGLTYGFYVRTLATSSSITVNGFANDRESLYFRGDFGTVEIGNGGSWSRRGAPAVTADWGPPTVAQSYLGPDGKLENVFVKDPNANRIYNALIKLGSDNISEGRVEHIAYFSPEISGFQAGFSYAPDGQSRNEEQFVTSTAGTAITQSATNLTQYQNIVAGGITKKLNLGPVATASQVEYIHAQSKNLFGPGNAASQANRNVSSVHTGFKANYAGFQWAIDYTYSGDSDTPKIGNQNPNLSNWGWATGLEYFYGPWVVGGYYWYARAPGLFAPNTSLGAPRTANGLWEMNNYEIGVGYTVAPGLKVYSAAYYYDDYDTHVTVAQNAVNAGNQRNPHGQVYLMGVAFDW